MEEILDLLEKENAFEWAKHIVLAIAYFWIGMRVVKVMILKGL